MESSLNNNCFRDKKPFWDRLKARNGNLSRPRYCTTIDVLARKELAQDDDLADGHEEDGGGAGKRPPEHTLIENLGALAAHGLAQPMMRLVSHHTAQVQMHFHGRHFHLRTDHGQFGLVVSIVN